MTWRCLLPWRRPDFVIGAPDDLYLRRWYIIPRNRFLNVYLHHFLRSDDDRALHDHPWVNLSILLRGSYVEVMPAVWPSEQESRCVRRPFRPVLRAAAAAHRVALIGGRPVWSLFITGPRVRDWGFHCPRGWRPHWEFTEVRPGGNQIGRGCE